MNTIENVAFEFGSNKCKCKFANYCPLAKNCTVNEREPNDPDRCYKLLYEDIDSTRIIIQDMTTRLGNTLFIAKELEKILNN